MRAEALALAYVAALSMANRRCAGRPARRKAELNNCRQRQRQLALRGSRLSRPTLTRRSTRITSKNAAESRPGLQPTFPDKEPTQTAPIVLRWHPSRRRPLHYTVALDGASCESRLAVRMEAEGPRDVHHPARRRHKGRQAGARHRGRFISWRWTARTGKRAVVAGRLRSPAKAISSAWRR